jgi:hypothetical protein
MQTEARNNDALDSIKALLLITKNRIAMRESNRRVNEKLENIDSKLKSNSNGHIDRNVFVVVESI